MLWHCWFGHIWPVKIVPDMTYNVFGGTLNFAQSLNLNQSLCYSWIDSSVETKHNCWQYWNKRNIYLILVTFRQQLLPSSNWKLSARSRYSCSRSPSLIGQHGGSGRSSKFDRKAKTSWIEMRGVFLLSHVYDGLLLSVATTVATHSGEFSVRRR